MDERRKDLTKRILRPLGSSTNQYLSAISGVKYSYKKQYERIVKEEECYPMTHSPRGRALVVTMTGNRAGWDSDAKELLIMFEYLNFYVQFMFDLTKEQLIKELKLFASSHENTKVDCLFVVLMGHGGVIETKKHEHKNKEYLATADGQAFFVREEFKLAFDNNENKHLAQKPKIFIVQMCRGGVLPEGVLVASEYDDSPHGLTSTRIPAQIQPDALACPDDRKAGLFTEYIFGFATQPGRKSMRHTVEGAWYIQELVRVFMERAADRQVTDILAEVNMRVQEKRACGDMKMVTQVAESVNALTKSLYLFPGLQKKGKPPRELIKPGQVLELPASANPEVQSAWRVLGLPDQGALITYGCEPTFKIMQVERDGKRKENNFITTSDVNALILQRNTEQGDQLLTAESKGRISRQSLDNLTHVTGTWSADVTSTWDADIFSQDELVLVDSLRGEVSIFSLVPNVQERKCVKVKGLDFPASVACYCKENETKVAVVEQGKHRVLIYEGGFTTEPVVIGGLGKEDGIISAPICCQFLPHSGNLLVCDRDNHRVSEFTIQGVFIRHWLTEEDKIKYPMSISFAMPYLWVVHAPGQKCIFKFEIFWYDQ